jgi:Tripartite tricarboxylate transporter TctB family
MKIRNYRDFWAGAMFILFGVLFMFLSRQYSLGTAAKMGPGYFPTVLGGLMAFLGLIVLLGSLSRKSTELKVSKFQLLPNLWVLGGVALFGLALPYLGFVVAAALLICISALASHEFSLRDTLIAAVVLVILCYFTFVRGLELQFPVWPKFLVS